MTASIVVDFALLAIGVAGLALSAVLSVRGMDCRVTWRSRRPHDLSFVIVLASTFIGSLGGARAQHRLGMGVWALAVVLFLAASEIPRLVHNRRIDLHNAGSHLLG